MCGLRRRLPCLASRGCSRPGWTSRIGDTSRGRLRGSQWARRPRQPLAAQCRGANLLLGSVGAHRRSRHARVRDQLRLLRLHRQCQAHREGNDGRQAERHLPTIENVNEPAHQRRTRRPRCGHTDPLIQPVRRLFASASAVDRRQLAVFVLAHISSTRPRRSFATAYLKRLFAVSSLTPVAMAISAKLRPPSSRITNASRWS